MKILDLVLAALLGLTSVTVLTTPQRRGAQAAQPARLQVMAELRGGPARPGSTAWSPDGSRIAIGGEPMSVTVWDVQPGRVVCELRRRPEGRFEWQRGITAVALSADNRMLAAGGQDGHIDLWSLPDCRRLGTLRGHTDPVGALDFSADGKLLASGSGGFSDYTARAWDVERQAARWTSSLQGIVSSVAVSPDASAVAVIAWDQVALLRASDGQVRRRHTVGGRHTPGEVVVFSPDGNRMLAGGDNGILVLLRATGPSAQPIRLPAKGRITAARFNAAGTSIVIVVDGQQLGSWSVAGRRQLSSHLLPDNTTNATLSGDGTLAAVRTPNGVSIFRIR